MSHNRCPSTARICFDLIRWSVSITSTESSSPREASAGAIFATSSRTLLRRCRRGAGPCRRPGKPSLVSRLGCANLSFRLPYCLLGKCQTRRLAGVEKRAGQWHNGGVVMAPLARWENRRGKGETVKEEISLVRLNTRGVMGTCALSGHKGIPQNGRHPDYPLRHPSKPLVRDLTFPHCPYDQADQESHHNQIWKME
jgi:hypothetical protein